MQQTKITTEFRAILGQLLTLMVARALRSPEAGYARVTCGIAQPLAFFQSRAASRVSSRACNSCGHLTCKPPLSLDNWIP